MNVIGKRIYRGLAKLLYPETAVKEYAQRIEDGQTHQYTQGHHEEYKEATLTLFSHSNLCVGHTISSILRHPEANYLFGTPLTN